MKNQTVTIQIASGLEARPVAVLVQMASQFESHIYLIRDNKKVNAKSIMGMMTLGLNAGESIEISADGKDEDAAVQSIAGYLGGEDEE
jgi:catabolite repression HPr-like protein